MYMLVNSYIRICICQVKPGSNRRSISIQRTCPSSDFRGVDVYITVALSPLPRLQFAAYPHHRYIHISLYFEMSTGVASTSRSDAQIIEFLVLCLEKSGKACGYRYPESMGLRWLIFGPGNYRQTSKKWQSVPHLSPTQPRLTKSSGT